MLTLWGILVWSLFHCLLMRMQIVIYALSIVNYLNKLPIMIWNMNCSFIIVFYMVLLLHKCTGISSWPVQFVFNKIIVLFIGSVLIAFLTLHPEMFYDLNNNFINSLWRFWNTKFLWTQIFSLAHDRNEKQGLIDVYCLIVLIC